MTEPRHASYTCPLCEATCGLQLTLEGERITAVRGDPDDVFSRGFVCPKGVALGQLYHDPDLLRSPQMRSEDGFRQAAWDEAYAEVERRLMPILEEHGRDAVAVYLGNPNVHNLAGALYARPLLMALGSKNIFTASTVDQMPKHVSSGYLFGNPNLIPVPDLDRTDYLLMLGANPRHSNGSLCTAPDFPGRISAIHERGGQVVVVDPRRSLTAKKASEHVAIRPGTDALLLFAMLHTVLAEKLVRPTPLLSDHTTGFEQLEELLTPFQPSAVAGPTGIAEATIRRLTRELASAERAVVYSRIGTHTAAFGTLTSWAVDALNLLLGQLDRPGGAMFPLPANRLPGDGTPGGRGFTIGRWRSRVRNLPEVRGELPVATLADEILTPGPGQVRALVTIAGNPVLSTPHSARLDEALASLEFMVSVDFYRNETTRHADVILPPPAAPARSHYDAAFYGLSVRNIANYSPALLPAAGPPEHEILARLTLIARGRGAAADPAQAHQALLRDTAKRVVKARGSRVQGRSADELLRLQEEQLGDREPTDRVIDLLIRAGAYGDGFGSHPGGLSLAHLEAHPHGVDLGPLTPLLPGALRTRSGQIELLAEPIVADIARLRASLTDESSGLLLIGRRHLRSNNSWMHNLPALAGGRALCTLQMHPEDAAARGLQAGALAQVTSRVGQVQAAVELTEDIMPGVVSLPHGYGHDRADTGQNVAAQRPGINSNVLTDPECIDPLSGNAVLNGIPVAVTTG